MSILEIKAQVATWNTFSNYKTEVQTSMYMYDGNISFALRCLIFNG